MKIKKLKPIFAISIAFVSVIASCTKEETKQNSVISNCKSNPEIPFFSNINDVEQALQDALSVNSLQDLIEFEDSYNRKSIGRIADDFYYNVDPEQFKTEEEVLKFVNNNSEYIDTLVDASGEISVEPMYSNNIFRYVANTDGLFIVADTVYKIFKHGIVFADRKYTGEIMRITEDDIPKINTSVFTWCGLNPEKSGSNQQTHAETCNYKKYFSNTTKNGRNRLSVEYYLQEYPISLLYYKPIVNIKSQHRCVFWWNKNRRITLSMSYSIHNSANGYWETIPYNITSATKDASTWQIMHNLIWVPNYTTDYVHIKRDGYIKASTSEAGTAVIIF